MKVELEDFKTAWADKPNRDKAKVKAEKYCRDNEARLAATYSHLTRDQIVAQVDFYRATGRDEDLVEADMWLLTHFEPQRIVGVFRKELTVEDVRKASGT